MSICTRMKSKVDWILVKVFYRLTVKNSAALKHILSNWPYINIYICIYIYIYIQTGLLFVNLSFPKSSRTAPYFSYSYFLYQAMAGTGATWNQLFLASKIIRIENYKKKSKFSKIKITAMETLVYAFQKINIDYAKMKIIFSRMYIRNHI